MAINNGIFQANYINNFEHPQKYVDIMENIIIINNAVVVQLKSLYVYF